MRASARLEPMNRNWAPSPFTASLVINCALVLALSCAFALYVVKEGEVDRANSFRHGSLLLADELRQTSDDLSRIAMSYVITGDAAFKKLYREVLEVREGKRPRPRGMGRSYWDMAIAGEDDRPSENARYVSLVELLGNSVLTDEESGMLRKAKANADSLIAVEQEAIELADSVGASAGEDRALALAMMHDANYQRARAAITRPIDDFRSLIEQRTLDAVRVAQRTALLERYVFVAIGLCLMAMLLRTYSILRNTMGGSIDEVHAQIAALGHGDFFDGALLGNGLRDSVLGWLAETRLKLVSLGRERERATGLLGESEAQFRQIAESIREVLFLGDVMGTKWLYVSPGYEKLWGRSCESLYRVPTSWREAIHPDDRTKVMTAIPGGSETGQVEVDFRIVRPDGTLRWILLRTFPIHDGAGNVQRIAGIAEDTTHRTRIEVVTQEADRRFNDLLDNVSLACLIVNAAGQITYCNDRLLELTGWSRFELLGRQAREVLDAIDSEVAGAPAPDEAPPRSWRTQATFASRDGGNVLMSWNSTMLYQDGIVSGMARIGERACDCEGISA
jgi:PAS domain S-box-containing protein